MVQAAEANGETEAHAPGQEPPQLKSELIHSAER